MGTSSGAFWSSTWRAAMKARPLSATKKNRSIIFCASSVPGGCVPPDSASAASDQCCLVFSCTPRAMASVVSRLYPAGGSTKPMTKFRLPMGR